MFCHKCGTQIPDDGIFCPKCGERIATASDETALLLPSADGTIEQSLLPLQKAATDPTYAPVLSVAGLFSPKGRRSRGKAWRVNLSLVVVLILSIIIDHMVLGRHIGPVCFSIGMLLCFLIGTINMIKRLHDIDRPGYWILALYGCGLLFALLNALINPSSRPASQTASSLKWIPFIFDLLFLIGVGYIAEKPGTVGPNKYGPDPADKPAEQMDSPPKN